MLGHRMYFPIVVDEQGNTPLKISFSRNLYNKYFIQEYMKNIQDYPIFSYGGEIAQNLSNCVQYEHNGFGEFLDSRLMKYGVFSSANW